MTNDLGSMLKKFFWRTAVPAEKSVVAAGEHGGGGSLASSMEAPLVDHTSNNCPSGESISEVWIRPDADALHNQTLLQARQIEEPVFKIGRRVSGMVHYPDANPADMLIVEKPPYTLSRMHCQIEIKKNKVILRDLGSRMGTRLGNKRLWKSSRRQSSIVVPKGSHRLVLGHPKGVFRFRLEVH